MTALRQKRVVIHEDDVGMSHGANTAFVELSKLGTCSSGSVMVPCPWFPEAAAIAVDDPSLDLGVHLTLTSEQTPYRWRPLTAPPRSAGLTDELGYFWPDVPTRAQGGRRRRWRAELRAQIDYALAAGIDADASRLPHGHGADAGVHRDLPPARPGLPAAGAAGEGSLALQSGELRRAARPRALRRRGRRGARRRRAGVRDRLRDALGPQDRRGDRLSRDLRRRSGRG